MNDLSDKVPDQDMQDKGKPYEVNEKPEDYTQLNRNNEPDTGPGEDVATNSPTHSVESDSNLKTDTTTESNSVEFSPEHLKDEATVDIIDELKKSDQLGIQPSGSLEAPIIVKNETPNTDECSNPTGITNETKENILDESGQPDTNQSEQVPQLKTTNDIKGKHLREENKAATQPQKTKLRSGKMVLCKVHLLDGQLYETDVTKNATGKELFDKVCNYLTLQEKEYFGLQYVNNNVKFWMNNEKKILKQVKGGTCVFDFSVKFYPPEPTAMLEDISRFQLCLQVRFDIFNGKLPCSFTTLAVLGSYMVQAEVGDYDNIDEYEFGPGDSYLDKIEYAPDKSSEMRSKVYELHRTHKGLSPEEAELQYLQNAKKLAMYGVDLHQARDSQGIKLMLGVCASGIQVYKDKLRINRFVWPAILKLSYKRNSFYVKKRPSEGEKDGETVSFKLDNHKMAKRVWKTCVEHHAFFRLHEADPPKSSTFPRFNSRFRYSGRTQKQVRDDVEKVENRPKFDRSHFKYSSMPQSNHTEGYPDEKDRTDQKGVTTPSTESGPPPYYNQDPDGYNKMESHADKPNNYGDTSEDRRDRIPAEGEAVEDYHGGAGDAATLEAARKGKKSKEEKEREKREKEEEKRRKKEEEKERKRLEKEKKLGKGSEDRTDKMEDTAATSGYNGDHVPGSEGLDSGQITSPLTPDAADSTKEHTRPVAEASIDDSNNNMAGLANVGVVSPGKSEDDKNRPLVSKETDIDGHGDKNNWNKDNKKDGMKRDDDLRKSDKSDDPKKSDKHDDHKKSDKQDDDKKKDKSKRKESDKSKDKKSGFFGRLKSPKDKDSKKWKGKESDLDSAPGSPTSPDSLNKKMVTTSENTVVEEKKDEASEKNVEVKIKNTLATKQNIEEKIPNSSQIVQNEVKSETKMEVEQSSSVLAPPVIEIKEDVSVVSESHTAKKKNEECKSEQAVIPDSNIGSEVVVVVEKSKVCDKVETGSLSSDSSDDEEICGSYHIESPMDDISNVKVETIVEEELSECKDVVIDEATTKTIVEQNSDEVKGKNNVVDTAEDKMKEAVGEKAIEQVRNEVEACDKVRMVDKVQTENKTEAIEKEKDQNDDITTEINEIVEKAQEIVNNGTKEDKAESNTDVQINYGIDTVTEEKQVSDKAEHHERNVEEKRDFDVVVSEQKCVSPDGKQVMTVKSERRTETIQKEVVTHTRRELRPEEFLKYEKEILAADEKNRLALQDKTKDFVESVQIVEVKTEEKIIGREDQEDIKVVESKTVVEPAEKQETAIKESNKTVEKESENKTAGIEEGVVEVKLVKADNDLEENVEKMKYIDESSGDSINVTVKQENKEVITPIINEEAGNDKAEVKIDKKESIRLKQEEKEKKKKELAEAKAQKKKEAAEEKERKKREKQEEKERLKQEKLEEKEKKKKEKQAEKERKQKEKQEKKNKKKGEPKPGEGIEEAKDAEIASERAAGKADKVSPSEEVQERVPTALAMVIAKQKEEAKMDEIDLKDEPAQEVEKEPEVVKEEQNQKSSKKEKKQKSKKEKITKKESQKTPKNKKKHKTTSCFAAAVESSDEEEPDIKVEEKPPEEVVEEVVQEEEVKPVQEEMKKGKGLGWALPGMEELQQKGTKHEENLSPTLSTPENTDELDKEAEKSEEKSQPENDTTVEVDTCSKTEPIDLVEVQENVEKIEIVSTKAAPEVKADMPSDSSTDTTESFKEIEDRKLEEQSSITSDGTASEVGMGGETISRVLPQGEGSIDRRMQFIPVTPPVQETKDSLKGNSSDRMPFFDPSSEDSLKKKRGPPVPPKGMRNGYSDEDRHLQDMPPTIPTESFTYENNMDDTPISTKNVPYVKTKTQTVTYEKDGYPYESEDGILISSQSHSTRTQTIETTTYKTEKDGKIETRVEKKVVITDEGDDDDLDHDDLLAEAIRSVTEMNPDLSVERIECMRQIEEVEK